MGAKTPLDRVGVGYPWMLGVSMGGWVLGSPWEGAGLHPWVPGTHLGWVGVGCLWVLGVPMGWVGARLGCVGLWGRGVWGGIGCVRLWGV